MEGLYQLLILSAIATVIVDTVKRYTNMHEVSDFVHKLITIAFPVLIGLAFSVFSDVNIFTILGVQINNLIIAKAVTAFFIGAGSNKIFDLYSLIKNNKEEIQDLVESFELEEDE